MLGSNTAVKHIIVEKNIHSHGQSGWSYGQTIYGFKEGEDQKNYVLLDLTVKRHGVMRTVKLLPARNSLIDKAIFVVAKLEALINPRSPND
jgi:hypothetical protein